MFVILNINDSENSLYFDFGLAFSYWSVDGCRYEIFKKIVLIVLKELFLFSSIDASFHISVCFPVVQILVVSNYS